MTLGHERDVKMSAGLCLETLNMLNYLTSDEVCKCWLTREQLLNVVDCRVD